MIWAFVFTLSLISISFVVAPLFWKKQRVVGDAEVTPAIFRDQLEEVERDRKSGLISDDEASAAELEIKRRILSAARKRKRQSTELSKGKKTLVVCALFTPLMALVYYQISGAPALPSVAFADRQAEREQARQTAKLTDQLLNKLNSAPDGGPTEGWLLLGRTYMSSGLFEEAAGVFEKLSTRADSNSATWSMLAEALIRLDNGVVTPKAENAISRSMALDSLNPAAAYYKALALAQTGREVEAHRLLVQRLKLSETYAPWMDSLVRQANIIGKSLGKPELDVSDFVDRPMRGPTAADVVAAQEMSAEGRTQFIRSMVEGLAARLEEQPDDLEGWLRLANAYKVLDERARAVMAYERADELIRNKFSSDDPRRQNIKDAISELKE